MKVWSTVLATLVLLAAIVEPPWVYSSTAAVKDELKKIKFSTTGATVESYRKFLEDLRSLLRSRDERHGIPVMRESSSITDPTDRFILVELENMAEQSVTIAIDVVNAYVVGYLGPGNEAYFFRDTVDLAWDKVFPDAWLNGLPFESSYTGLQRAGGRKRENIDLGVSELDSAITNLYFTNTQAELGPQARGLLVIIQMISEAARFRYIEGRVRTSIRNDNQKFRPDGPMISLETNWDSLSQAVQQNTWPVQLVGRDGEPLTIEGVTSNLINLLALMLFICRDQPKMQNYITTFSARSLFPSNLSEPEAQCVDPERTSHIVGRDGLCVDLKEGLYHDGNLVIISPCVSGKASQEWTVKSDGTIRSQGKCMTTSGYNRGDYVMIYDCGKVDPLSTSWTILEHGKIEKFNSVYFVLTAPGSAGATLVLDAPFDAPCQTWLPSDQWNPFVTTIIGYNELCLDTDGVGVWVEKCVTNKASQQWAMYVDSTIRPQSNRTRCMMSEGFDGDPVVVSPCTGYPGMGWRFNNDGTVFNLRIGNVLDVKGSDPSLKEIILSLPNGNPNQEWITMF